MHSAVKHEMVMQTMLKAGYARGMTTAELLEGINSCPQFGRNPSHEPSKYVVANFVVD